MKSRLFAQVLTVTFPLLTLLSTSISHGAACVTAIKPMSTSTAARMSGEFLDSALLSDRHSPHGVSPEEVSRLPEWNHENVFEQQMPFYLYQASLSCQDLSTLRLGLKAATYTFNVVSLGLACAQIGVPVAVGLFGVGFVLYSAELVVSELSCEDGSKAAQEAALRREICSALTQQGIECDPSRMTRR